MSESDYAQDPPIKTKPAGDRGERYPSPVANFEAWFKARCHEAATAKSMGALNDTVGMVRAYSDAEWCMPNRVNEIGRIAQKRSVELSRGTGKMAAGGN
jgi:hypothetical protein